MTKRRGDRGTVTVEFALTLPVVVAVLALVLGALMAASEGAAVDAAALAAARAAVIEDDARAAAVGVRVAGVGAAVEVRRDPGWVLVTVTAEPRWPWPARSATIALPEQP